MKASKYNFFYPYKNNNNKIIAYNSRSNVLSLMEKASFEKYKNFINKSIEIDDENLVKDLVKGQYLIDDNIDELNILKYNFLRSCYSTKGLGLTIAPTLDCNFACIYCYEKKGRKNLDMSVDVQDKVIEFVKDNIPTINSLHIMWYGGEPLLAFNSIKYMSEKIIDLCDKNDIKYTAGMVTNGYNLNKTVAKELAALRINFLQVTIDGIKEIHDQRRPLAGGQGTFDKIIENLLESYSEVERISLRINIDKKNASQLDDLLIELEKKDLPQKIAVYLGLVEGTNNCYDEDLCVSMQEFSGLSYNFEKTLIKNDGYDILIGYPTLRGNVCSADTLNGFVIDPKGLLYKCWSDIGIEDMAVGSLVINKDFRPNANLLYKYMLFDPTSDGECKNCNMLPLCMGGCPKRRLDNNPNRCTKYKYNLEEYLQWVVENLKKDDKLGDTISSI